MKISRVAVLIGPCGIETRCYHTHAQALRVLIGPCGIETDYCFGRLLPETKVLIGPCGIETEHTRKKL